MSGSSGRKIATPVVEPLPEPPPPAPIPTELDPAVRQKAEATRKKLMARKGRASTILTDTLGQPMTGGKTLLGA